MISSIREDTQPIGTRTKESLKTNTAMTWGQHHIAAALWESSTTVAACLNGSRWTLQWWVHTGHTNNPSCHAIPSGPPPPPPPLTPVLRGPYPLQAQPYLLIRSAEKMVFSPWSIAATLRLWGEGGGAAG